MMLLISIISLLVMSQEGVSSEQDFYCDKDGDEACHIQHGIPWHEFDWKSYIKLDWKPELDGKDPVKRFGINLEKSIELGVSRSVSDFRPLECREVDWHQHDPLPTASVIITYRDEPRSTLLRTVVSVIENTPDEVLKEVILVDDNNDDATIGQALSVIKKVKVMRNDQREGLIRSRIKGTHAAMGQVLVFLDSHCEVEPDWIQPLLIRVKKNPKVVASPVIDNINLFDFHFEPVSTYLRGGFNWQLDFFWEWLPAKDMSMRMMNPVSTFKTPAIAGGLFAIDKNWFLELGTYDDQMEIWGGENIEFSLRAWTCGGEMEIVPCSKVGHIYKLKNVYSYPKGFEVTTACNLRRTAEVWLDQFSQIFDLAQPSSKLKLDCGDTSKRKAIRKEKGCQSFQWYLENVYPELQLPRDTDLAFGPIHFNQPGFLKCIDSIALGVEQLYGSNTCLQSFHPQRFRMDFEGKIVQNDFCLTLSELKTGAQIISHACEKGSSLQIFKRVRPNSKAKLQGYQFRHEPSRLCLDVSHIKTKGLVALKCDDKSPDQRFLFDIDIRKVPLNKN